MQKLVDFSSNIHLPSWALDPYWYESKAVGCIRPIGLWVIRNVQQVIDYVRREHMFFLFVHFMYFVGLSFIAAVVVYGTELMEETSFVDCLFLTFSAMTATGLETVNFHQCTTTTQVIVWLLTLAGSHTGMIIPPLLARRYYYRSNFKIRSEAAEREDVASVSAYRSRPESRSQSATDLFASFNAGGVPETCLEVPELAEDEEVQFDASVPIPITPPAASDKPENNENITPAARPSLVGLPISLTPRVVALSSGTVGGVVAGVVGGVAGTPLSMPGRLSFTPHIARPSLMWEDHLPDIHAPEHYTDGVEYAALGVLASSVFLYWILVQLVFTLIIGLYVHTAPTVIAKLESQQISGWWFALFSTTMAYQNSCFTLFPDSLMQFATDGFLLSVFMWLIVMGNTLFPFFLRQIVRFRWHFARNKEPYNYLLDFPRNCTTHMFRRAETRYLFIVWGVIMLLQLFAFLILDYDSAYMSHFDGMQKLLISLFQAVSTRTAGLNVVDMEQINEAMLLLFLFFMYISVYPQVLTMKHTALLETEEAMNNNQGGVSALDFNDGRLNTKQNLKVSFQTLLLRDIFWLYTSLFLISCVESSLISVDRNVGIFYVLFEIISAYGNVGLTVGYPGTVTCLATKWGSFAKLLLIVVMVLGRHRGLPHSLDIAVFSTTATERKANKPVWTAGDTKYTISRRKSSNGRARLAIVRQRSGHLSSVGGSVTEEWVQQRIGQLPTRAASTV
eukprot:GILJ01007746.1.p1 GENE.GILJ01007746.1~~GILJ01007746.1.p1  ORF type:complete len:733 (+),score=63.97 GILJ01007746.1:155-2353(+)